MLVFALKLDSAIWSYASTVEKRLWKLPWVFAYNWPRNGLPNWRWQIVIRE